MQAPLIRREDSPWPVITVFGTRWRGDTRRTRAFRNRNSIPYPVVDLSYDERTARKVVHWNEGYLSTATVGLGGRIYTELNNEVLAGSLSLHVEDRPRPARIPPGGLGVAADGGQKPRCQGRAVRLRAEPNLKTADGRIWKTHMGLRRGQMAHQRSLGETWPPAAHASETLSHCRRGRVLHDGWQALSALNIPSHAVLTEPGFRQHVSALVAVDPDLGQVIARYGDPPLWVRAAGLPGLVLGIVSQQLSRESARAIYLRLEQAVGTITPQSILALDLNALRKIGLSRQKAEYVRGVAEDVASGRLNFAQLESLSDEEALRRLSASGEWVLDGECLPALRAAQARRLALGRPRFGEGLQGDQGLAGSTQHQGYGPHRREVASSARRGRQGFSFSTI